MQNSHSSVKLLFIVFIVFSLILSSSIMLIEELFFEQSAQKVALKNAEKKSFERERVIKEFLDSSKQNLQAIRTSNYFELFLDEKKKKEDIEQLFLTLSDSQANFFQLRYIDENGNEQIRVDRKSLGEKPVLTSQEMLQNKSTRYYFKDSKVKEPESIWFSAIDLNIEKGEVEKPFKPTLRAVLPVEKNKKFGGILIINYFMSDFFEKFVDMPFYDMILFDDSGRSIYHYANETIKYKNCWGNTLPQGYKIFDEFGTLAKEILSSKVTHTQEFISRKLDLPIYGGLNLLLKPRESYIVQEQQNTLEQYIAITFIVFFLSIILTFFVIKLFSRALLNLDKLKELNSELHSLQLRNNVALQASKIGIWEWDYATNTMKWDTQMYKIHGLEPEVGEQAFDIWKKSVDEDDMDRVEKTLLSAAEKEKDFDISFWITTPDSQKRYIKAFGINEFDANNKPYRMIGTNLDMTDIKEKSLALDRAQVEISNALDRYDKALAVTEDGIWDWDVESMSVYYSPTWKSIIGYKDDEIENLFSEWEKLVHPDDLEYAAGEAMKLARGEVENYSIEFRMLCKDGSSKTILSRAKIVAKDTNGKPKRIVGTHVDVQDNKELLKGVLDSSLSGIMAFKAVRNKDGVIVDFIYTLVNKKAQEIVGQNAHELLGKYLLSIMPGHIEDGLFDIYVNVTDTQESLEREFYYEHEGLKHWFYQIVVPYKNGFVVTFSDITESKNLIEDNTRKENLLLQQSKLAAMGEMIGAIAHQWRQPLATISGALFNILDAYNDKELDKEYLENMLALSDKNIKYMSKTIDDFRNYFSPTKEKMPFYLEDSIINALGIVGVQLRENGIEVTINCHGKSFKQLLENIDCSKKALVDGYENEFSQVIINLLANARDAILDNPSIKKKIISISVYTDEDINFIEILDNGGGIPEELVDKVFEPYFTTKDQGKGTGIGLYMSKMIVENMDGKIFAQNKDNGARLQIQIKRMKS